ncbi:hypothetical protein ABZW30_20855 [Kitasatospora sp. NPDC004669]|uniref:hypothetical protein n=1 Tax=Kitasatospora sp. NPDC004669 TaxID=3154555 RepID=UPI0033B8D710
MGDDAAKAGGPEFKLRPGDLKDAAPTFETQSKALKDALDKLKKSLAEDGAPWGNVGGIETENACRAAVRWATLRDTPEVRLPDLPDPFEPLILLYEQGGEVIADESRAFNFGGRAVRITPWRDHLSAEPATALDPATLDALDREYERANVDRW